MEKLDNYNEKRGNLVAVKSFSFALRVVKAHQQLCQKKHEYVLSKQLLRSGTSIGANIEEALGGYSRADFAAKLGIAYKEARESSYWIRLLRASGYFTDAEATSLHRDVDELLRIIGSIRVALRRH
jgi:four helix bundle protein